MKRRDHQRISEQIGRLLHDIPSAEWNALSLAGKKQGLMTVREAAPYLGTSVWQVRKLANAGRIKFVQLGSGKSAMLFRRELLDRFVEKEEV